MQWRFSDFRLLDPYGGDNGWKSTILELLEHSYGRAVRSFTASAEDEEGNLYFTGTTESSGDRDLWIVKTDSGGNHIFTKTYGGSQWKWGHDIKRTNDGNFIVTGLNHLIAHFYVSSGF
ncbi:MAG: hypothetical protein U5J96_14060 [Ignavibacteriaceae bacterium]|nr:hypothetical protein [Ignavibacteriaceae bacterium]